MTQERLIKKLHKLQRSADRFCERRGIEDKARSSDYQSYMEEREALILKHAGLFPDDHPVAIKAELLRTRNDAMEMIKSKNKFRMIIDKLAKEGTDVPAAWTEQYGKLEGQFAAHLKKAQGLEDSLRESCLKYPGVFGAVR